MPVSFKVFISIAQDYISKNRYKMLLWVQRYAGAGVQGAALAPWRGYRVASRWEDVSSLTERLTDRRAPVHN